MDGEFAVGGKGDFGQRCVRAIEELRSLDGMTVEKAEQQSTELAVLADPDWVFLENLLVTKGCYGWQYLFADVDLKEPAFHGKVRQLRSMLQTFPELFPDHDYGDLQARLAARL